MGLPDAAGDLLVGPNTGDDAAVYRIAPDRALIATVDFFTPIVDDPADWGRIAAANALSDVYAMGGTPLLCLNIAGWPRDVLPLALLGRVLEAGAAVAREAGAFVAGGHTIDAPEPTYGMAVVGFVHPDHLVTNSAARPGDLLYLTKPIGTGAITTALKNGLATPDVVTAAVETMAALNDKAAAALNTAGAKAGTDVTGFGLLGHLHKLCLASGVSARIESASVPVLAGAREALIAGQTSGGTKRNMAFVAPAVAYADDVSEQTRALLCDAQTSGGLLVAIAPDRAQALEDAYVEQGVVAARIGSIGNERAGSIVVT